MGAIVHTPWTVMAMSLACPGFAAFVVFVAIVRARRRLANRAGPRPPPPAFDLAELSRMVAAGTLTPAEFDRLRDALARRQVAGPPPPPAGPRGFEVLPHKG